MLIKIEEFGEKKEFASLEDYAEATLDGNDHGIGSMEAAADTAKNNSQAIGRLLDTLVGKGILDASEVVKVIGGYPLGNNSSVKIIKGN